MDGVVQPAPSPRFSRTEASLSHSSRIPGEDSREVLLGAGLSDGEIDELLSQNVIYIPAAI
jgi:alpha-methylacyl-CoA racemase